MPSVSTAQINPYYICHGDSLYLVSPLIRLGSTGLRKSSIPHFAWQSSYTLVYTSCKAVSLSFLVMCCAIILMCKKIRTRRAPKVYLVAGLLPCGRAAVLLQQLRSMCQYTMQFCARVMPSHYIDHHNSCVCWIMLKHSSQAL